VKADELVIKYEKEIKKLGIEVFLYKTEQNKEFKTLLFLEKEKNVEGMAFRAVIYDLHDIINVDYYIDIEPKNEKVYKIVKHLDIDDEGLVLINSDYVLKNHGIIFSNYLIYYHPFLRRYYGSNFTNITYSLGEIALNKEINLKIAIDPIRISTPNNYNEVMELDYWYGPKFSKNKLNDINFKGITVHGRTTTKEFINSWPLDRTEFYVANKKDGCKEIQIEEIHSKDAMYSKKYRIHKYAHFIWNKEKNCFEHFDCAVKIYSIKEYLKRASYKWKPKNINNEAKAKKIKLFRLDGLINFEVARGILSDFFIYNENIGEFFEKN
jgi:hypothetical protein